MFTPETSGRPPRDWPYLFTLHNPGEQWRTLLALEMRSMRTNEWRVAVPCGHTVHVPKLGTVNSRYRNTLGTPKKCACNVILALQAQICM